MFRQEIPRIDSKRRANFDPKRRQFAPEAHTLVEYPHRLNLYDSPPTSEITLEQFEQWAIDRLRILAELETCSFRNKTQTETITHLEPLLRKYLPLSSNSSSSSARPAERQKDHYSHFILRLAFSRTEDLRRRFAKLETSLFRMRFMQDDSRERASFVESLNLEWEAVGEEERAVLAKELIAAGGGYREDARWFKVEWERVPELVESRRVFLKGGKAYVPVREQLSLVVAEFSSQLERGLELTSRALPRLDEDDRLTPILNHLSTHFSTPAFASSTSSDALASSAISAATIPAIAQHFPLCMKHLQTTLATTHHLKHFGRLQYTLFLKGIGLSLDDAIQFWRQSFSSITDDRFNKDYRYNVRHAYGDVGGDANRRGRGYSPFSCQKILIEHHPNTGDAHGCPYRHFSVDNLTSLLQATGVTDRDVLKEVREDVGKSRYHIACNKVFEHTHKAEIKRAKDEEGWGAAELDTIVHPNTYFKRSYLLKNFGQAKAEEGPGDAMEIEGGN
ncbi:hypothetical protein FGG08_003078 [Glutinoglossum americanum]|uniref:DNA primase large subunit n=1 Tax=Glutinoglossum americanum TaxID=1670608 RepID=A0A9P8I566_9PEZI|nr:hypothetical protein FGG08_003078 [Glutinoglossum americanum]